MAQLGGMVIYILSMVIETAAGGLNIAAPIIVVVLIDVAFVRIAHAHTKLIALATDSGRER